MSQAFGPPKSIWRAAGQYRGGTEGAEAVEVRGSVEVWGSLTLSVHELDGGEASSGSLGCRGLYQRAHGYYMWILYSISCWYNAVIAVKTRGN